MLRVILSLFGFGSILFLSPIFVFAVVILLSIRYPAWEVIFMGLAMDFMWSPGGSLFLMIPFATLFAIFIVWALEPLRSELLHA